MENADLKGATLVFDLDGTLVDTAPDLLRTLNHILDTVGCPPRPMDDVRPFMGLGARRIITEGLKASGRQVSDAETDALFEKFLGFYSENIAVESRPYPGVEAVLEVAGAAGARLAICTNKMERLTQILLKELDLNRHLHGVAGRDTFPVCKPDPVHLKGAVELAGGALERAVMIGDNATDINTAKAASVPSVAVTFGYSEISPAELGADVLIDHYDELLPALERILMPQSRLSK